MATKKSDAPKTVKLKALVNVPSSMVDPADLHGPSKKKGSTFEVEEGREEAILKAGYAEKA